MELKYINGYYITVQRNGNNVNGNPVYLINFFDNDLFNINGSITQKQVRKLDKNSNIKIVSANVNNAVERILTQLP
jgi:hypothetical protein